MMVIIFQKLITLYYAFLANNGIVFNAILQLTVLLASMVTIYKIKNVTNA